MRERNGSIGAHSNSIFALKTRQGPRPEVHAAQSSSQMANITKSQQELARLELFHSFLFRSGNLDLSVTSESSTFTSAIAVCSRCCSLGLFKLCYITAWPGPRPMSNPTIRLRLIQLSRRSWDRIYRRRRTLCCPLRSKDRNCRFVRRRHGFSLGMWRLFRLRARRTCKRRSVFQRQKKANINLVRPISMYGVHAGVDDHEVDLGRSNTQIAGPCLSSP